ncbi:MAG: hypothetical protein A2847_00805 [Candidatus Sungbacteria bacterium RIFCSPHIGHO2_01_FULL_50_25]|uniref:Uncharacterized protein n=1 Tax=Candidatus Sungbacteria bacterium RIFCSPHIGHO2_01_FULL_50_25 TaxID=1802265 RepID=A0A1G2KBV9_9BACT|nr:MAG: hypothetical protein A2847_00805 [Candidatus Sungbacteria bacterium RIFCSPHIGHO2_01_FULL_50_25]
MRIYERNKVSLKPTRVQVKSKKYRNNGRLKPATLYFTFWRILCPTSIRNWNERICAFTIYPPKNPASKLSTESKNRITELSLRPLLTRVLINFYAASELIAVEMILL